MSSDHLFYEKVINRKGQQEFIEQILAKYRHYPADEKLKELIWNDLMAAQHRGELTIPVSVSLCHDPNDQYPNYVKIELDTRV